MPDDFYNAMMCVEKTRQWIQAIDARRRLQTPACIIERAFVKLLNALIRMA